MNFVRGESTDTAEKGERFRWSTSAASVRAPQLPAGNRKRPRIDEEEDDSYFDDDDEPAAAAPVEADDPLDAFMAELHGRDAPRPPSTAAAPAAAPSAAAGAAKAKAKAAAASHATAASTGAAASEEVDPLDAFMAGLSSAPAAPRLSWSGRPAVEQCDEELDPVASYLEDEERRAAATAEEEADDADGEASGARRQLKGQKGGAIGAELGAIDHDAIEYEVFAKELYTAHPTIRLLGAEEVRARREELRLSVSGFDVPAPIARFEHAGLPRDLLAAVRKQGYDAPTPIQMQALPVAMSGRDLIGVASTGSGKTAAYLLPMASHIMAQRELRRGEGPIGLVVAPTHELAEQVAGPDVLGSPDVDAGGSRRLLTASEGFRHLSTASRHLPTASRHLPTASCNLPQPHADALAAP